MNESSIKNLDDDTTKEINSDRDQYLDDMNNVFSVFFFHSDYFLYYYFLAYEKGFFTKHISKQLQLC
jgi:hypothetical protein